METGELERGSERDTATHREYEKVPRDNAMGEIEI